jgi:hypothetical protein
LGALPAVVATLNFTVITAMPAVLAVVLAAVRVSIRKGGTRYNNADSDAQYHHRFEFHFGIPLQDSMTNFDAANIGPRRFS